MLDNSRIEDLLDQWEDHLESGERLSFGSFVARYCADDNDEILDSLKTKIAAIESMNEILGYD